MRGISDLNSNEYKALKTASAALYFDDSSDYCSALWEVVSELLNISSDEDIDIDDIFNKTRNNE